MEQLVEALESRRLTWGIVTNKAERFALPLMKLLGYATRAACIIGGDTTGKTKPHPEPLYAAARAINIEPVACIYVGDDERDIQAGRAAGMKTVAVRYGYLNGSDPAAWGADAVVDTPMEILQLITP
jgi:N-acetyl-D-muramate 6-phosphate phosphatase